MNLLTITLPIIFLMLIIGSNSLPFSNIVLINGKRESYQACLRLKKNAPDLNLKCEKLKENINLEETQHIHIKILSSDAIETRKVKKGEEIKLRKLIKNLSKGNNLRKNK